MIGATSAGISYPCDSSQVFSAAGSCEESCTVSYGPTTSSAMTVTPPPVALLAVGPTPEDGPAAPAPLLPPQTGGPGHVMVGETTSVFVSASSCEKRASELRPIVTVPRI